MATRTNAAAAFAQTEEERRRRQREAEQAKRNRTASKNDGVEKPNKPTVFSLARAKQLLQNDQGEYPTLLSSGLMDRSRQIGQKARDTLTSLMGVSRSIGETARSVFSSPEEGPAPMEGTGVAETIQPESKTWLSRLIGGRNAERVKDFGRGVKQAVPFTDQPIDRELGTAGRIGNTIADMSGSAALGALGGTSATLAKALIPAAAGYGGYRLGSQATQSVAEDDALLAGTPPPDVPQFTADLPPPQAVNTPMASPESAPPTTREQILQLLQETGQDNALGISPEEVALIRELFPDERAALPKGFFGKFWDAALRGHGAHPDQSRRADPTTEMLRDVVRQNLLNRVNSRGRSPQQQGELDLLLSEYENELGRRGAGQEQFLQEMLLRNPDILGQEGLEERLGTGVDSAALQSIRSSRGRDVSPIDLLLMEVLRNRLGAGAGAGAGPVGPDLDLSMLNQ